MGLDVRCGDALEGMVEANEAGHRILIVGSVCHLRPTDSVKAYLGRMNEVHAIFPDLVASVEKARPHGVVYYVAMSPRYPHVGIVQVSTRYPFVEPDINITRVSLRVVESTSHQWAQTHLFVPAHLGAGTFWPRLHGLLHGYRADLIVWTGDLSVGE